MVFTGSRASRAWDSGFESVAWSQRFYNMAAWLLRKGKGALIVACRGICRAYASGGEVLRLPRQATAQVITRF